MKYLLDSDVCLDALRRRGPVATRVVRCSPDDLAISTINLAELEYGVLRDPNPEAQRRRLDAFLAAPIAVIPFDVPAARVQARLRLALRARLIRSHVLLIASVAIANDLTFVTQNTREFSRVPGLALEDWSSA